MSNSYPRARVVNLPEDENTRLVREVHEEPAPIALVDPDAVAFIRAVAKHDCNNTLKLNEDRVAHFKQRLADRGLSPKDFLIVILNVDDPHGGPLAETLMPGMDWQPIRDQGQIPFARGLANREPIRKVLASFDGEAAEKLRTLDGVAVVVMDHGVAEVYSV